MVITAEKAVELVNTKNTVREITLEDLFASSTTPGFIQPKDVLQSVINTIGENLAIVGDFDYRKIKLLASHIDITSINGEETIIDPEAKDSLSKTLTGYQPDENVDVTVKYNRLQAYIPVGMEGEMMDAVAFTYSLDRSKFILVPGKLVTVSNNFNVFSRDSILRGNSRNIGAAIIGLEEYLQRYHDVSAEYTNALAKMRKHWMDVPNINQMFTDHHYISALFAKKERRKGIKQTFSDAILKTAHYLMYETIHPYLLDSRENGDIVYNIYNSFVEALHENNADLINTFERHLATFQYFNDSWVNSRTDIANV